MQFHPSLTFNSFGEFGALIVAMERDAFCTIIPGLEAPHPLFNMFTYFVYVYLNICCGNQSPTCDLQIHIRYQCCLRGNLQLKTVDTFIKHMPHFDMQLWRETLMIIGISRSLVFHSLCCHWQCQSLLAKKLWWQALCLEQPLDVYKSCSNKHMQLKLEFDTWYRRGVVVKRLTTCWSRLCTHCAFESRAIFGKIIMFWGGADHPAGKGKGLLLLCFLFRFCFFWKLRSSSVSSLPNSIWKTLLIMLTAQELSIGIGVVDFSSQMAEIWGWGWSG